jgi:O-antigen/teichoic acid export membrane protein
LSPGHTPFLAKAIWTTGSYFASIALKLGANLILTRLLAPEIFGIMVVVNTIKLGIELLTDVGIEQNIVQNQNGLEPEFFNTAWTIQIVRGAFLSAVFASMAPFLASLYGIDLSIFLVISISPVLSSLHSTSVFMLVKNLEVQRRNLFELASEFLGFSIMVTLAAITPTVWALVIGSISSVAVRAALTHAIPHPAHRLTLHGPSVRQIVKFGKWIMLSSLLVYAASNVDRIYLGKMEAMSILGLYGLARTIAELPAMLAGRLSYQIVFPALSAARGRSPGVIKAGLVPSRRVFVLLAALAIATSTAWADWAIRILYDPRYYAAGWMLFLLLIGAWFSVLSNLNEAVLLGFGQPAYGTFANGIRLSCLAVGLPLGYLSFGLAGAVVAVIIGELSRYTSVLFGQRRVGLSFVGQDGVATTAMIMGVCVWVILRQMLGLGVPWDAVTHGGYGQ